MAVIHNDFESINDRMNRKKHGVVKSCGISLVVSVISFFLVFYSGSIKIGTFNIKHDYVSYFFLFVSIISLYLFYKKAKAYNTQNDINIAGAEGEGRALTYLQLLDNRFHIIPNAVLTHGEKRSEMDFIIAGPTGVFITEVKNHKGYIYGKTGDQNLMQVKTDSYGNKFEKPFYNPCKQISTHRYTLNGVLSDFGIKVYIDDCVLFSSKEVSVNITKNDTSDCRIFTDGGELINYIKSGDEYFSSHNISNAVNAVLANKGSQFREQTKI